MREVRASAPGKVNLTLRVGPPTPDGYHPLVTVFEALSLLIFFGVGGIAPKTPMDTRSRAPMVAVPLFFIMNPFFRSGFYNFQLFCKIFKRNATFKSG